MADDQFYRSVAGMSPSSPAAVPSAPPPIAGRKSGKPTKTERKQSEQKEELGEPHDIRGEPLTGYEDRVVDGVDLGVFNCGNCFHFVGPPGEKGPKRGEKGCSQLDMREKSKRARFPDGRVKVDPGGCCEWVDRLGKVESYSEEKGEKGEKKENEGEPPAAKADESKK